MATNFFVVFNRREQSEKQVTPRAVGTGTLLGAQTTAPLGTGQLEDACVLKVEVPNPGATGIKEAQLITQQVYPGLVTGTPVVVAEAQFKEA
jgi:hypothetical protein